MPEETLPHHPTSDIHVVTRNPWGGFHILNPPVTRYGGVYSQPPPQDSD
jgi:hypothetical protein